MAILAILFGFTILVNGSDFAAMHGSHAQELELPGSSIIPYVPWVSLGAYIVAVFVIWKIKTRWIRWIAFGCATVVGHVTVAYPIRVLDRESTRIPTIESLNIESQAVFKAAFPIQSVSYSSSKDGACVRVKRSDYSTALAEFVTNLAKNQTARAFFLKPLSKRLSPSKPSQISPTLPNRPSPSPSPPSTKST